MKLKDKVAMVTGASRGIGRAVAIELARQGANVVLNDVDHGPGTSEAVAEIDAMGRRRLVCQADVGERREVEAMLAQTLSTFGRLDILVSNATFSTRKPFLELEPEEVAKTWSVLLWGAFHCCQLAARQMVKQGQGGSIVVVSSVHAWRPYPRAAAYNAAKAALSQMAYSMAAELIPYGIRVNVLEPGWTDTPGERRYNTEEQLREGARLVLCGRLARPEEIARGVAFLVSEEDASYVTGSCLRMDGGYSLAH